MNDRINLALWKNDKRTKTTQPPLAGGKPVVIDGKQYWLSAYINGPKGDDAARERIEKMIDYLAGANGTYPIVSLSLTPADKKSDRTMEMDDGRRDAFSEPQAAPSFDDMVRQEMDDIPF